MASRAKKKSDTGYRLAVVSLRSVFTILVLILAVVLLVFLGRKAYAFGYEVFYQTPVDSGEGESKVVIITEDMSVTAVGDLLRSQGLIEESSLVFWFQELLSDYHGKIQPGTYVLKTSQVPREMLGILARAQTEGQIYLPPEETDEDGSGGDS